MSNIKYQYTISTGRASESESIFIKTMTTLKDKMPPNLYFKLYSSPLVHFHKQIQRVCKFRLGVCTIL